MIATIALPRLMRIGAGASSELGNIFATRPFTAYSSLPIKHSVELGKLEKLMEASTVQSPRNVVLRGCS